MQKCENLDAAGVIRVPERTLFRKSSTSSGSRAALLGRSELKVHIARKMVGDSPMVSVFIFT